MTTQQTRGDQLREMRQHLRLSQVELAEKISKRISKTITPQTILNYERNYTTPKQWYIDTLAQMVLEAGKSTTESKLAQAMKIVKGNA